MPITPDVYTVSSRAHGDLAIMAKPRAGDWLSDEIVGLRQLGFEVLVSFLEGDEIDELGLAGEPACCRRLGIDYLTFPIADRGIPESLPDALALIDEVIAHLLAGRSVVVHCRSGIGRAGMMAAAVLVRGGLAADDAFERISAARRVPVPDTDEQRDWVRSLPPPPHSTRLAL